MFDQKQETDLRQAIELMYFAYRSFTAGPDSILAQRGLGRVHHRIMYFVGRNPGTTVSTLLEILQVSKQALNSPLRQLIAQHLVAMAIPEHDRRLRSLRLTHDGSQLERQLTSTQMEWLYTAFSRVSPEAVQHWQELMTGLAYTPSPRS